MWLKIRKSLFVRMYLLLGMFVAMSVSSCKPNGGNSDAKLEFSADTLYFDTVFTTISSVTRSFTVKNTTAEALEIDISLAGGKQSYFSINVDGVSGTDFRSVEIPAHDSIFVFVKVNINPTNSNNPYLITDSVMFYKNKEKQAVQLVAFGQDAHFIIPTNTSSSMHYSVVAQEHENVHWTNDKPWVIYGWAVVDSLGSLTIDPGTKIYVHNGGGIWVYRYGNIQINGTSDMPVVIRGDRLESFFANDYAQWDRIWINEGSSDNIINNVEISNAAIGLQVSALTEYTGNKTIVNNSIIHNNQKIGVLARSANLEMNNCQISNNGQYSMALQVGDFELNHLTVANYFTQSVRKTPAVALTNFYDEYEYDPNGEIVNVVYLGNTNLKFNNSIIYGALDNEFTTSSNSNADLNYTFNHCIVKKDSVENNSHFISSSNENPKFVSNYGQNYNLKEDSPAIDAGFIIPGISTDILGRSRNGMPDIGAYEFYPSEDRKFSR